MKFNRKRNLASRFYRSVPRVLLKLIIFALALILIQATGCGQGKRPSGPALKQGVVGLTVERRILLGYGVAFGGAGSYETLVGKVYYALDHGNEHNRKVTDLKYACGPDGLVHWSAEFVIVKPTILSRGNGALLYHVVNRGNFDNRVLNSEPWAEIASSPSGAGESLARLMKQGFTIVFSGWQDDILDGGKEKRLSLYATEATAEGRPLPGEVIAEIESASGEKEADLGTAGHRPYAVAPEYEDQAELRVHESYADPGSVIERSRWRFARVDKGTPVPDSVHVFFPEGFGQFKIYTVRYRTNRSPVMGLCFPAVRDLVAFLCSTDTLNPLLGKEVACPIRWRLAYGSSQSGRFLRNFLYQGFNRALNDSRVFDGVLSNVPGCRMGFFNYRHAQPSRVAGFYPNFDFPFSDLPSTDSVTGRTDGILRDVPEAYRPRIFYLHHSGEYWSSGAALTHADVQGLGDLEIPINVRIYFLTGTAHGHAELKEGHPQDMPDYLLPFNPNSPSYIEAPLMEALARWVIFNEEPPQSAYPRLDKGELEALENFKFPAVPDVDPPVLVDLHPRFEWGSGFADGILDKPLPGIGPLYPVLVPAVDETGNEAAGIKSPHISVPLASYTGWNFPRNYRGADKTCASLLSGAWLPFSRDRQERLSRGDSRKSLAERYKSKSRYLAELHQAALDLVGRRLLFSEDIPRVLTEGEAMYEYVSRNGAWKKESVSRKGSK